jgi:hypothetical protein
MTAPRKKRSVHTRDGLAVIIAATLLFASCRNGAQFLALSELRVVRQQVSAVAGTTDVSVNLANGRVLTITVGNADVRANSGAQRQELFLQIATAAYLALPSRSQVEAVTVKDVAETHQFRPIQLIEPSGLADRWVKPDHTSQQVYFVAVGNVRFDLVKQLAAHAQELTTALSISSSGSGSHGPYPSAEFRASLPTSDRFAVEPFVTFGSQRKPARGSEGFYGVQIRHASRT